MPLVRVRAFQHNSWAKRREYERFTFCQHCKKTGRKSQWEPISLKRMSCSLRTIEGWVIKTQGNGRATGSCGKMPFCGIRAQACKQDSWKNGNQTFGQIYLPTKCARAAKSLFMHQALLVLCCMNNFWLAPIDFRSFLQSPAVYSYKMRGFTVWVQFQGGSASMDGRSSCLA